MSEEDREQAQCCTESLYHVMLYCVTCGSRLCPSHSSERPDGCRVCGGRDHLAEPFRFRCAQCRAEVKHLPKAVDGSPPPPYGVYKRVGEWKDPPDQPRFYCDNCADAEPRLWRRIP